MLRAVLLATLVVLVVLVLYPPSIMSPQDYYQLLRDERASVTALWGDGQSRRIDALATRVYRASLQPPLPGPLGDDRRVDAANKAAGPAADSLPGRLGNNDYARSLEGALSLAAYRISAFLMFMPFFIPFTVAAVVDGFVERRVRSVGFINDSAGLYGLYAGCAVFLLCTAVVALAWPDSVHPTLLALIPIGVAFLVGRAAANFRQVL